MAPKTPLLDEIQSPDDLKKFKPEQLQQIADELRAETIDAVSVTGGHLGAGLGVVELTVALHYLFDTPGDRIIWDVGHQAYPHKILTGRRDQIRTLRQGKGLSGFTKRLLDSGNYQATPNLDQCAAAKHYQHLQAIKHIEGPGAPSPELRLEVALTVEMFGSPLPVAMSFADRQT